MKIRQIDFLRLTESIARTMSRNGIRPEDVNNIKVVDDYLRLRSEGHKYEYIMRYLCEQYDIRRTSLYNVVKRLTSEIDI